MESFAPSRSGISLYGRLLALAPTLPDTKLGMVLFDTARPNLELAVLGVRDTFRRIEIRELSVRGLEDEVEPSPDIQLICCTQLQSACVVGYWHPELFPAAYASSSHDVSQSPQRIPTRLTIAYLNQLIGEGLQIVRPRLHLAGASE